MFVKKTAGRGSKKPTEINVNINDVICMSLIGDLILMSLAHIL